MYIGKCLYPYWKLFSTSDYGEQQPYLLNNFIFLLLFNILPTIITKLYICVHFDLLLNILF